jgi:PEP-CTERM motif
MTIMKKYIPLLALLITASSSVHAQNLITNGDFSAGNTGFTSSYTFVTAPVAGAAEYGIETAPSNIHPAWSTFGDHTTGTGNMFVGNGATSANVSFWSQTFTVVPSTDYYFSGWVASAYADPSPANIAFIANGATLGTLTPTSTAGDWIVAEYVWNSGTNTSVTLSLVDNNLAPSGNDFVIDDLAFGTTSALVPEPGSLLLLALGGSLVLVKRRQH